MLFIDSPANLMAICTGMYVLSVFMVGYSLTSRRADPTQIQHHSISQGPRHRNNIETGSICAPVETSMVLRTMYLDVSTVVSVDLWPGVQNQAST